MIRKEKNRNQHLHPDIQPTPRYQRGEDRLLCRDGQTVCPSLSSEVLQMLKIWMPQESL